MTAAYLFQRDVEHKLQMVYDFPPHSLPAEADGLEGCAVRMGHGENDRTTARKRLSIDHVYHTKVVHEQFASLFSPPESFPIFHAVLTAVTIKSRLRRSDNL